MSDRMDSKKGNISAILDRPADRRSFLKWTASVGAALSVARQGLGPGGLRLKAAEASPAPREEIKVTSCSHDCGGRCVLVCHLKDGIVTRISTDDGSLLDTYGLDTPEVPQIRACLRGRSYRKRLYSPYRLKYPMKRIGERGEGKFKRISWDEAYDTIAKEMVRVKETHGPASILDMCFAGDTVSLLSELYPFLPWALVRRFLDCFGCAVHFWDTMCFEGAIFAANYTVGDLLDGCEADNFLHSKLILMWGFNPTHSIHGTNTPWYLKLAKEKGCKFVSIDPRYTDSAAAYDAWWIPIRPGTDVAMMLGMAYVMIDEDLCDKEFLDKYTLGFDEEHMPKGSPPNGSFKSYVLGLSDGVKKTPRWAEAITGVPANDIAKLARMYATIKPSALIHCWGPGRQPWGEQFHRGGYTLAAMTGNFGKLGTHVGGIGGALPITAAIFPPTKPPVKTTIKESKWADAVLLGEKAPSDFIGNFGDAPPPNIKMIYGAGHNFMQQTMNIPKNIEALKKIEFFVFHEQMMNFTAKFADILLPVATHFEAEDGAAIWVRGRYIIHRDKIIEPMFESKRDLEILTDLAERLGFRERFNPKSRQEWIRDWVDGLSRQFEAPIDHDEFIKKGLYKFRYSTPVVAFKDEIEDPDENPFATPSGKIEIYSQEMAEMDWKQSKYGSPIPPIPTYVEGWDNINDPKKKYPLKAITPKIRFRTHSIYYENPWLRETYIQHMMIHPEDAKPRGLESGDVAKVYNDRGTILTPVYVTDRIVRGVVSIPQGAWCDLGEDGVDRAGCANMLTEDRDSPSGAWPLNAPHVEVRKTDQSYRPGWDMEKGSRATLGKAPVE
jgi:anaerobic dimethyl sulfoxide reductase subunit A